MERDVLAKLPSASNGSSKDPCCEEHIIQRKVEMLEAVQALDPEKNNVVRSMLSFRIDSLSCLSCVVLEMLDRILLDLMIERRWTRCTSSLETVHLYIHYSGSAESAS